MPSLKSAASIERLKRRLAKVPPAVRAAAAAEALLQAHALVQAMQRVAPADIGNLRESVRIEGGRFGDRFYVKAGGPTTTRPVREGVSATYDYALGIEFGTAKMKAKPFFYPTYRANRAQMRRSIQNVIRKAARLEGQA